jgi:hypothetical protein
MGFTGSLPFSLGNQRTNVFEFNFLTQGDREVRGKETSTGYFAYCCSSLLTTKCND